MPDTPTVAVRFGPSLSLWLEILRHLDAATRSIDLATYQLTCDLLASKLLQTHTRGLDIRIIADKWHSNDPNSHIRELARHGVPAWLDDRHKAFHHKYIVIDKSTIITGSANLTANARMYHAETLLTITNAPALATQFTQDFESHLAHSLRVTP